MFSCDDASYKVCGVVSFCLELIVLHMIIVLIRLAVSFVFDSYTVLQVLLFFDLAVLAVSHWL